MLLARSGVSLLLGLAALAAAPQGASADPPSAPAGSPAFAPPPLQVAGPAARAPDAGPGPDKDAARRAMALNDEGWALYEKGHYRAAVEKLEAALRIDPEGRELRYNLAVLHEKLADMKEAAEDYRRYLEKERDPKARARVLATLRRIEGAAEEAAAREPLAPVRDVVAAPPSPPPPPRPIRPWVIATGAVAGAAFLIGSVFGFTALERNPGAGARTGDGVSIADLQDAAHAAHTDAVVADVSFVIAAAAAGTAAFLYFATPRATSVGPAGAGAGVAGLAGVTVGPGVARVVF